MRKNGLPEHDHSAPGVGGPSLRPRKLRTPNYPSVDDVEDPEVGEIVFLNGVGEAPRGRWRYTEAGWVSGAANTRFTLSESQRTVSSGETFTISQFEIPDSWDGGDTTIAVWNAYISTTQGPTNGLFVEVDDTTADDSLVSREADRTAVQVDTLGAPLAAGGSAGNTIRVQTRNTTNQQRTFITHVSLSIERIQRP